MYIYANRVAIRLGASLLLAITAVALSGCQFRPTLVSANSERVGDEDRVRLKLHSIDAEKIKARQMYFSVVVSNCSEQSDEFPMEPYIGGRRASEFQFETGGESVEIVGRVPARIFDTYSEPCAFLRGGGYLTGTIRSSQVRINRSTADGV